jgi:hypothetical protein
MMQEANFDKYGLIEFNFSVRVDIGAAFVPTS